MDTKSKAAEKEARTRDMIAAFTPEDLAESVQARKDFGPSYGYADGQEWWDTMQRSFPALFKSETPPERPSWLDATIDPAITEATEWLLKPGSKHSHAFLISLVGQVIGGKSLSPKQAAAVLKFKANDRPAPKITAIPESEPITDGMYRKGDEIFKVQIAVNGSGRLYAKKLVKTGDSWTFEYAPGAIRTLKPSDKMTLEEAKAWGALYGTCCVCGRTLTDEESIAAGIGPICAGRV